MYFSSSCVSRYVVLCGTLFEVVNLTYSIPPGEYKNKYFVYELFAHFDLAL